MSRHGDTPDMIAVLKADHRAMAELFAQLEQVAGSRTGESARLVRQLISEMVRHATVEEEYLYPAIRQSVPDGDGLAGHEILEHQRAMEIMKRLERIRPYQIDFWPTVHELVAQIRQHERQQELQTFPLLRQHMSADDLHRLGEKITDAKRTAPTRPHPDAPHIPPWNRLAAPVIGLFDRVYDALARRRQRRR